jgi:hypothetical protein
MHKREAISPLGLMHDSAKQAQLRLGRERYGGMSA